MERKILERNKRADYLAKRLISIGGVFILICVIGILALLIEVTLPLFFGSGQTKLTRFALPEAAGKPMALLLDEYLEKGLWLSDQGHYFVIDLVQEQVSQSHPLPDWVGGRKILFVERQGTLFSSLLSSGDFRLDRLALVPVYEGDEIPKRVVRPQVENLLQVEPSEFAEQPLQVIGRQGEDSAVVAALLPSGRLQILRKGAAAQSDDLMAMFLAENSDEAAPEVQGFILDSPYPIQNFTLSGNGEKLYAYTAEGRVLAWNLGEESAELVDEVLPFGEPHPLTAMALVFGDQSLAIGDAQGQLFSLAGVTGPYGNRHLTLVHRFQRHSSSIVEIQTSLRHKAILSRDQTGRVHLDHVTSEKHLLEFVALAGLKLFDLGPRGNGLFALDQAKRLHLWSVSTPHPEINFKSLFQKLWYEGYDEPALVWQSSAGADDFEAKFSLTPLIFGSLKGSLYAMLFALPLGILGAVYTNEFASPRFRAWVKPTVEITAAVPSVIIGFIAALWLAPLIHQGLLTFFLYLVLLHMGFGLFLFIWARLRCQKRFQKFEQSRELLLMIPLAVLILFVAMLIAPGVEGVFFGGDFHRWILENLASDYDQRNSIIIAFALGFIVIPFIFTMTDDALSGVPPSLKAASQALGASRWQTLWKVLLPSASPGIFAGVILGMGRAIGETMIVLMATGNTPIIDLSPFNGMRTLSANIAVEIPEAPVDGTLYRVLFLSAVILFAFTFVINSLAEIVRSALRKRYAQF